MLKRLTSTLGAVALVAVSGAFATSQSAHAAPATPPVPNTVILQSTVYSPTLCVDFSVKDGLQAFQCAGDNAQEWRMPFLNSAQTLVRFQNVATDACLEEDPGRGLRATGCDPSVAGQQWWASIWTDGDGNLRGWFENVAVNNGCLDLSTEYGVRVALCDPNGEDDPHQIFLLE